MIRAVFALCLAFATALPTAAQPFPENKAATPPSQAPGRCEPYPACVLTTSPLRPGAPGIGIRDKALIDLLQGPVRQPEKESATKKPDQQ
jgi:hypothetical protein